jgi:hypothetical protein
VGPAGYPLHEQRYRVRAGVVVTELDERGDVEQAPIEPALVDRRTASCGTTYRWPPVYVVENDIDRLPGPGVTVPAFAPSATTTRSPVIRVMLRVFAVTTPLAVGVATAGAADAGGMTATAKPNATAAAPLRLMLNCTGAPLVRFWVRGQNLGRSRCPHRSSEAYRPGCIRLSADITRVSDYLVDAGCGRCFS